MSCGAGLHAPHCQWGARIHRSVFKTYRISALGAAGWMPSGSANGSSSTGDEVFEVGAGLSSSDNASDILVMIKSRKSMRLMGTRRVQNRHRHVQTCRDTDTRRTSIGWANDRRVVQNDCLLPTSLVRRKMTSWVLATLAEENLKVKIAIVSPQR